MGAPRLWQAFTDEPALLSPSAGDNPEAAKLAAVLDMIRLLREDLKDQKAQLLDLQAQIDLINSRLAPRKK
jgi:hypothetical protein